MGTWAETNALWADASRNWLLLTVPGNWNDGDTLWNADEELWGRNSVAIFTNVAVAQTSLSNTALAPVLVSN